MSLINDLQGFHLLEGFFSYTPFLISYAEIHYHLKFLYPKYFKKEPEIITDIPIRIIKDESCTIPLLLIIKDAHLYPVTVKTVNVKISTCCNNFYQRFTIDKFINNRYYSKIMNVNVNDIETDQYLEITAEIEVDIAGDHQKIINDNYPDILKRPYRIFYAKEPLPLPKNWFAGETHYHSIHTADQVEFGADLKSTAKLAKAMGFSWLFITDHSYDLDDSLTCYTENDARLPKWKLMQKEVKKLDSKNFRIIAGEEVSIGNHKAENVHLLAMNNDKFISGHGDSAEKWFKNKPQHDLTEISKLHNRSNLFIAAHPFEKIPFLQKLTLNRGNWNKQDYENSNICFLQAINNSDPEIVNSSVNSWRELLLKGCKYYLIAGNDAHGNFNVMRQIKTPFWKLFSSQKQVFGNYFTVLKFDDIDPIAGLKKGEIIVSNGPFLNFNLKTREKHFSLGSSFKSEQAKLYYECKTSTEFGKIGNLSVFIGDQITGKEKKIVNPKNKLVIKLPKKGYVRMSMTTENGGRAFTNPIWIT